MPKCDFNKAAKQLYWNENGCFPVNLLHIFWTPFPKNSSVGLLLSFSFHLHPRRCSMKNPRMEILYLLFEKFFWFDIIWFWKCYWVFTRGSLWLYKRFHRMQLEQCLDEFTLSIRGCSYGVYVRWFSSRVHMEVSISLQKVCCVTVKRLFFFCNFMGFY